MTKAAEEFELPDFDDEEVDDPSSFSGPLEWYWHFSQRSDFQTDSDQLRVLERLEQLFNELEDFRQYRAGKINRLVTNLGAGRKPPRGVYIWGGVGRGKSLMMDAFFKVSRHKRKRRVHFHEFMREIHARMRGLSGVEDPLAEIAAQISRELRLLCFDEFHVGDIADAMILARLLELMIAKGVVIVLTSNYPPDDLYPNGLQRSRFLPAIEILKRELDVMHLGGRTDHRRRLLSGLKVYYTPIDEQADANLARFFEAMTKAGYQENSALDLGGRSIHYRRRAKGVIWFDFAELCEKARSQVDYLAIASAYHTVLVSGVPRLKAEKTDVIRRFTWLVDVFYDQRVKLVLSAEVPAEELVAPATETTGAQKMVRNEFARTASRLLEMQSKEYFGRKHSSAENPQGLQGRA
ncbi:cell division protein ZapE [Usitatibacter palustris]|uniref:Cell division protein ZapE n=1 Tax=Usitatibacter palustris TaxID=2732487 RepID=A0A6M4H868_9PROT|nr:cell division protein ZapE [Usitatibacter palustris]QJR14903.1 Cell division protein ZapE [Usitatibacter palustris]